MLGLRTSSRYCTNTLVGGSCLVGAQTQAKMGTKYSRQEFEGYTHRFIVRMKVDNDWRNDTNLNIYSNSDSYEEFEAFVKAKKSEKVISFEIIHRASKEQDEMSSKLIDEVLGGL